MEEVGGKIRWAEKINRSLIRRLYEQDARGIVDAELIGEVGIALLVRCKDILIATAANNGRVTCPRCQAEFSSSRGQDALHCNCGWAGSLQAYRLSLKGRHLDGGTATAFFREYAERFPHARTPLARMLLIDRLLNQWHYWATKSWETAGRPDMKWKGQVEGEVIRVPTRPTASNLIEGKHVVEFLDELGGIDQRVQLPERNELWDEQAEDR